MSLPRLPLVALVVLLSLQTISSAHAAAEIPLSPVRFGPSSAPNNFRFSTAVASSGHGYLVAWEERYMEFYPPGAIMVRAFDERGRPLRPAATVLVGGVVPSIAWNGREYLVVFGELGSRFGSVGPLIVAAMMRVSEDGVPIDQAPVVIARQINAYTRTTSVAWNGFEYLVCWSGYTRGAVLVSPDLQMRMLDVTAFGWPMETASAPVIRQSDLMHAAPLHIERRHATGDERASPATSSTTSWRFPRSRTLGSWKRKC